MKFGIDMGHNAPPDRGASSRFGSEDVLTKEVGTLLISKLKALGHSVVNCTPSRASSVLDSVRRRVQTANAQNVDIYVSIHFNAFNGSVNGTEVFAISSAGKRIAQPVLDSIVKLGFFNRRVKDGSHLYVLKHTHMPGILIECCFIDSAKDMNRYNTGRMVDAILIGLVGKLPPKQKEEDDEDDRVLELQKALNSLKIRDQNEKPLVEDGLIGPATGAATRKFQEMINLETTGRADVVTWNALKEILSQPTLRPNHAEGAAVKYVQALVGVKADGVYGEQTANAIKTYQRQRGLEADGIVGAQTWKSFASPPPAKSDLFLKTLRNTVLKQEPIDSRLIKDPKDKYAISGGEELGLSSWKEEGNHVKVAFAEIKFNDRNTWYAFTDHIEIWKEGKPLKLEPEEEAPQIEERQDAFNLPGYTSTFYLSNPIIANGHFFWREALRNGERIPKYKSHVDNMVALARRLERVRDRLGGFPLTITSWYRPEPWNSQAGGAKYSRHLIGQAVDILRPGMTGRQMASRLQDWPGGMGIYRHYPNLLHLDIRPYRARWGGA